MSEEHVFDLLPGYALESLDEEDLLKVSRHLPHCASCRMELATYMETVDQLALTVPLRNPPTHLKARVVQKVLSQSAPYARPVPIEQTKSNFLDSIRSFFSTPTRLFAGGLVVLLVLFLGINNFLLWQRVNDLQARVPGSNIRIVQMQGTVDAPKAMAYLMVFKNEGYGSLSVEDAPILDANHEYQVWLIQNGKRTNGGVFTVNENGYGVLEIITNQPLENYQSFGITIEPLGGSPQPTGKKILGGNL